LKKTLLESIWNAILPFIVTGFLIALFVVIVNVT